MQCFLQEQYLHKDMNISAKDMDLKTTDHKATIIANKRSKTIYGKDKTNK